MDASGLSGPSLKSQNYATDLGLLQKVVITGISGTGTRSLGQLIQDCAHLYAYISYLKQGMETPAGDTAA